MEQTVCKSHQARNGSNVGNYIDEDDSGHGRQARPNDWYQWDVSDHERANVG